MRVRRFAVGESAAAASAHVAVRMVKLFDLGQAPSHIQNAIRPIAIFHVANVGGCAIWEVTVGSYAWQDAAEEWALHSWLCVVGATDGEKCSLNATTSTRTSRTEKACRAARRGAVASRRWWKLEVA
jgi:hypothetical protein